MDLKAYISTSPRGTAASLAKAIGVSPSYLSQMASGQSPISPERCVAIEKATAAAVSRRDLWPDGWDCVWPELEEAAHGQQ